MENSKHNIYESEIDLIELFKIIWNKKYLILFITMLSTIVSLIYIYSIKPTYQAKALLELGYFKTDVNKKNYLMNSKELNKKLNQVFITSEKNSLFKTISIARGFSNFLEIKVNAESNDLATSKINELILYLNKKEVKILDRRFDNIMKNINILDIELEKIISFEIKNLERQLALYKLTLTNTKSQLLLLEKKLKKINTNDYTLLFLEQNEKNVLQNKISDISLNILKLNKELYDVKNDKIKVLKQEKKFLEKELLAENNVKTQLVGDIITNSYPVSPKKKFILLISFISSFIFSVVLVFFLQFIKKLKEEKDD